MAVKKQPKKIRDSHKSKSRIIFCKKLVHCNGNYGNVHFTPLWYPDGSYAVRAKLSDLWTPAGMINQEYKSNTINTQYSAYDDWYVGR